MATFRTGTMARPAGPAAARRASARLAPVPGRPAQLLTLAATCLGLFLVQMDTTAVNLALPAVSRRLHGDLAGLQWVLDAYNVAFAAILLTGGALGDRYGRRRFFLIGITAFLAGSLVSALSPVLPLLIAGRAIQGTGAALAIPQSLALLATTFPTGGARNRAMAAWAVATGVGLAAGPTVGGALVDLAGWQSIFYLNIPVGIAVVAVAVIGISESANPHAPPLDLPGQLLAAGFLGLLTFGIVEGPDLGWTSRPMALGWLLAVLLLCAFVGIERRTERPMLPLALLKRGQLTVAAGVAACMTFGMYGLLLLASLDLQQQRGASPLVAGVELLPLPAAFALLSPFVGRLVTRIGPRLPMTLGMTLMGAGLVVFAAVGGQAPFVEMEAIFVVLGVGLALNTGPVVGVAVGSVAPNRAGVASGVANLARMLGATLGVAVLGAVVASRAGSGPPVHGFLGGLSLALGIGGAVELMGALIAWRWVAK